MYQEQAKFDEAVQNYERSLEIKIRVVGHDHPDVAGTYNKYEVFFCLNSVLSLCGLQHR